MHLQIPQTAVYPLISPYLTAAPRKRPRPNSTDLPSITLQICTNAMRWVQESCMQKRYSWSSCSDTRQCHPHSYCPPAEAIFPWRCRTHQAKPTSAMWSVKLRVTDCVQDQWLPLEGTPMLSSHLHFLSPLCIPIEHFHQLPWTNSGAQAAKSTKTAENKSRKKNPNFISLFLLRQWAELAHARDYTRAPVCGHSGSRTGKHSWWATLKPGKRGQQVAPHTHILWHQWAVRSAQADVERQPWNMRIHTEADAGILS